MDNAVSPGARRDVDAFLRHLADERQLSANSVFAYGRDLAQLCDFLDEFLAGREWTWTDEDVDRLALRGLHGESAGQIVDPAGKSRQTGVDFC